MNTEESIFVTYCGKVGNFYGQLDSRSTADFKALEAELVAYYGSTSTKKSCDNLLLYDDKKSHHIGDAGVIKWTAENHFYRVEVVEELLDQKVVKNKV